MTSEGGLFFPDSPRAIFGRHQLTQVICQLRFPPILRIEGEPPANFQERIRGRFPLLEKTGRVVLPVDLAPQIAQFLAPTTGGVNYQFRTEDTKYTLSLVQDAIALMTTGYTRWEAFWELLEPALTALVDIYNPSFFTRIGLRYQNAIQREAIGLAGHPWSELLRSEVLGELALPQFESNFRQALRILRLGRPDDRFRLLLQHGLGTMAGYPENSYVIDFDFYTDQKTGVHDAGPILDKFHRRAGTALG